MNTITYNSVDFATIGCDVEKWTPLDAVGRARSAVGYPLARGVTVGMGDSQPMEVSFEMVVRPTTLLTLYQCIQTLRYTLDTGTEASLTFSGFGDDRYLLAQHDGKPLKMRYVNEDCYKFTLTFLCQPYALSTTLTEVGSWWSPIVIDADPFTYDTPVSDVVAGNIETPLCLTIANGSGLEIPSGTIRVTNYTNGDDVTINNAMPDYTAFVIDSDNDKQYTWDGVNDPVRVYGRLGGTPFGIRLQGGVQNKLIFYGATGCAFSFTYRARIL